LSLASRRAGRRRADLALISGILILGVVFSAMSGERQSQVEAAVRATALFPFLELHRASAERSAVGRRAATLEQERDRLVEEVTSFRALAEQAEELRQLSGLQAPDLGSVRPAEVYPGRPRVGDPDAFVLRGSLGGLEFPVGVFTGSGLVGVARAAHGSGARGEFWSHPDFRVSVVTEDGSVSGIARPERPDGGQPILLLQGAPFQSDIPPGTKLVTTGIAGVYPPGIPVGTVQGVASEEAGWMKSYHVEPAVLPAQTTLVLVWVRPPLEELIGDSAAVGSTGADTMSLAPAARADSAPPPEGTGT